MNWRIALPPWAVWLALTLTLAQIVACNAKTAADDLRLETVPSAQDIVAEDDPLATAAAEATAIVQRAQATALILQAQSEAQATIQAATGDEPIEREPVAGGADVPDQEAPATPLAPAGPTATIPIEVLSLGFAAEGGMIQVRFRAPVAVADRWLQGSVYLIDEASGAEYKEIPVMPRIGPLFGKPARDGQPGYFMLVNAPVPLQPGAKVTVVLGDHIEEGLIISQ